MYLVKVKNIYHTENNLIDVVTEKQMGNYNYREAIANLKDMDYVNVTTEDMLAYDINREKIDFDNPEVMEYIQERVDPTILVGLYDLIKRINNRKGK